MQPKHQPSAFASIGGQLESICGIGPGRSTVDHCLILQKPRVLKRDYKEKRPDVWEERRTPNENGDGYQATPTDNKAFEEYYKRQGIVPEGEWDAFMSSLRTPLPATFRINGTGRFAAHLRDKLETDFFAKLQQESIEVCTHLGTISTRMP